MSVAVDRFLERLDRVKRTPSGWQARCPAHDDRAPSLSVAEGDDGRVLVRCHAGCGLEDVLGALGLEARELFEASGDVSAPIRAEPRSERAQVRRAAVRVPEADVRRYADALRANEAALVRLEELRGWSREAVDKLELGLDAEARIVFPVRSGAGELVGLVRYLPNPATRNGARKAHATGPRELFPPPERLAPGERAWLVEGEADAVAGQSVGLAATGLPGAGNWQPEWAHRFRGRRVVVCFDADREGRKAAPRVAGDLAAVAAEVRLLDWGERDDGYDLSDALRLATTPELREQARRWLEDCAERAPVVESSDEARSDAPHAVEAAELDARPFARELDDFLAAKSDAPAALLGSEREPLLPAGGLLLVAGGAGDGKTTLSTTAALHLASGVEWLGLAVPRPLRVLLIENEGPREPFRAKLERQRTAWRHELTGAVFVFDRDWGALTFADVPARAELRAFLERERIDLVIGDPLGSLGVEGVGSPAETRAFVALLVELGLRRDVAFWLLHHNRKEQSGNELDALSGDWGKHADAVLGLRALEGNRARLTFPKLRWAHGRRAAAVLAFEPEGESFSVVSTEDEQRDLAAELAELLADGEWRTVSELSVKRDDGGIGANRKHVTGTLEGNPERFCSRPGSELGRSARATCWQLVRPSVQVVQVGGSAQGSDYLYDPFSLEGSVQVGGERLSADAVQVVQVEQEGES